MKWFPAVCVNGNSKKSGCIVEYVLENGLYTSVQFLQKCENHKDVKESDLFQTLLTETKTTEDARDVVRQAFKENIYQQPLTLELLHKYHPRLKDEFLANADEQAPYHLDVNRQLTITLPEELKPEQATLETKVAEKNDKASLR